MAKTGVAKAQEEQRQFRTLKDELADLGKKIESAKARYESFQFDQAEHDRLKKVLTDLNAAYGELSQKVSLLESRKLTAINELGVIEPKLKKLKDELKELEGAHDTTSKRHKQLTKEIGDMEREQARHRASKKGTVDPELADVRKASEEAKVILKGLTDDVAAARKEAKELEPKRKKHADLIKQISKAQGRVDILATSISDMERKHSKRIKAREDLEAEIEQKRKDFDAECAKKTAALNLREKDLVNREGDVDFLKDNLKKKAGLLRDAKYDLEQHHGKPLRHIVIPEVEDK